MHNYILNYNREVYRKIIHITSSLIPLSIYILGKDILLPILIIFAIIFPLLDYIRRFQPLIKKLYNHLFSFVTRDNEENALSGASWVFIGSALTLLFFNENIAIVSLLIMSISDSAAAIIGIKYGKTKLFKKSLEGSCAYFVVTSIILLLTLTNNILIIILIALISTLTELFIILKINDNLSIPLITGYFILIFGKI